MNTNPNGYDGGDVAGFLDPSPWLEGCDRMNCTAIVGGDHVPTCEVEANRCGICGRDTSDGLYINTSKADGSVERICDICIEKGDDGIDIPLDYTEDEDESWTNREGQPEFNGAFGG